MRGSWTRWFPCVVWLLASSAAVQAQVVLLKNGGLFEGQLQRDANRIAILLPDGGRIQLDLSSVDYVGPDAASAFNYQRNRLAPEDVEGQVRLFHWAVRHGLSQPAAILLAQLRTTYPNRSDLESLEKLLHHPPSGVARIDRRPAPSPDTPVAVSPATLRQFADRIQPLLMNRCANAGCHGHRGESMFSLRTAGTQAREPRQLTLANLRSALDFVNLDDPTSSPILVRSLQPHGSADRVPLGEIGQKAAYQALLNWIAQAARDQGHAAGSPSTDEFGDQSSERSGVGPVPSGSDLEALDPEEFNRRFLDSQHDASGGESLPQSTTESSADPAIGDAIAPDPATHDPGGTNSPNVE